MWEWHVNANGLGLNHSSLAFFFLLAAISALAGTPARSLSLLEVGLSRFEPGKRWRRTRWARREDMNLTGC